MIKTFRIEPRKDVSRRAKAFPPGYRKLRDCSYRLRRSRAQKDQQRNKCLGSLPIDFDYFPISKKHSFGFWYIYI